MKSHRSQSPNSAVRLLAAGLLACLFLAACNRSYDNPADPENGNPAGAGGNGGGNGDTIEVVVLKPDSIRVEDMQLTEGEPAATPQVDWYPADFADKRFTLSSGNPRVAGVEGVTIKPLAAGTARCTLRTESGHLKTTFTVAVAAKPKPGDKPIRVEFVSAKPMTLLVGDEGSPDLAWKPSNASDKGYSLSLLQNSDKVEIRGGKVYAKAKGMADILLTTRDGQKTASFTVTVVERDTRIRVDSLTVRDTSVILGQEGQPDIRWFPSNASERTYTLKSEAPSTVSVQGGKYRGEAPGTATLIAVADDDPAKFAVFEVAVVVPVSRVTADTMAFTLGDAPRAPAVAFEPAQATDRRYRLSSADPRVAAVDGDTLVVPVAPGTTQVTLTAFDGGAAHTFQVTVAAKVIPVKSIAVKDMTLVPGAPDADPEITWDPADATDKGYALSASPSADPAAEVAGNKVRALKGGERTFTVTPAGGGQPVSFRVTVIASVQSITAADLVLSDGDRNVLPEITWFPADATDKAYTLSTSDTDKVAVHGGSIDAKKPGVAAITITTRDGNRQATFTARVMQAKCVDIVLANLLPAEIACCRETGKECKNNNGGGGGDDDGGDD